MNVKLKTRRPTRLDTLIEGRYDIVRFADLPRPHQLAMAHYMAVDGEGWDNFLKLRRTPASRPAIRAALEAALPQYVQQYGNVRFGKTQLPVRDLFESILKDPEIARDWPDWKSYHAWYCSPDSGGSVNHPPRHRWPVILSSFEDETLQDGWHRFHCYVRQRARVIPALFYPQPHHL